MKLKGLSSGLRLALVTFGIIGSVSVSAKCLDDVDKYRFDKELYNECIREANSSDDGYLQYLVALWNLTGVKEVDFETKPNKNGYKHFIYLAAQNNNLDAMSMYVITEYDRENIENNGKDLNMVRYLNSLSADKTPEGVLRMLSTKMAIGQFRDSIELPELEKIAEDHENIKANYILAEYYQSKASPAKYNPESIEKAYKYYENVLNSKQDNNDVNHYKGRTLWNLFNYYRAAEKPEIVLKSKPYLEQLAMKGDLLAMMTYASSLTTSLYGVIDEPEAYAWFNKGIACAKGSIYEADFATKAQTLLDKLIAGMSAEDKAKGEKRLEQLNKNVTCIIRNKPQRPVADNQKNDTGKDSGAGEKK